MQCHLTLMFPPNRSIVPVVGRERSILNRHSNAEGKKIIDWKWGHWHTLAIQLAPRRKIWLLASGDKGSSLAKYLIHRMLSSRLVWMNMIIFLDIVIGLKRFFSSKTWWISYLKSPDSSHCLFAVLKQEYLSLTLQSVYDVHQICCTYQYVFACVWIIFMIYTTVYVLKWSNI